MNLPPATTPEASQAQLRELLRNLCAQLGAGADETEHILANGCLRLEGVDVALSLNAQTQHLEFYADGGLPRLADERDLYGHLLEQALSNEIPALSFALHPQSRHVVAKGSLFLPALDEEGSLCTALLLAAVDRVRELQERFSLAPQEHT